MQGSPVRVVALCHMHSSHNEYKPETTHGQINTRLQRQTKTKKLVEFFLGLATLIFFSMSVQIYIHIFLFVVVFVVFKAFVAFLFLFFSLSVCLSVSVSVSVSLSLSLSLSGRT